MQHVITCIVTLNYYNMALTHELMYWIKGKVFDMKYWDNWYVCYKIITAINKVYNTDPEGNIKPNWNAW